MLRALTPPPGRGGRAAAGEDSPTGPAWLEIRRSCASALYGSLRSAPLPGGEAVTLPLLVKLQVHHRYPLCHMPAAAPELSVVIPALNEVQNVGPLVEEIDRTVRGAGIDAE